MPHAESTAAVWRKFPGTKERTASPGLVLALSARAGPGVAIDLTGSWNLSGNCKVFPGAQVIKSGVEDIVVNVTQSGSGLNANAAPLNLDAFLMPQSSRWTASLRPIVYVQ